MYFLKSWCAAEIALIPDVYKITFSRLSLQQAVACMHTSLPDLSDPDLTVGRL